MSTRTYTGVLVDMVCGACGIPFAMPRELDETCHRDHSKQWHCPNGHPRVYVGETEAQKLKRELKAERDRVAAERARADGAEASLRTTKGHVTRLRKRVIEGECPLCGQHLRDLARHVARVHPGETAEIEE